MAAYTYVGDAGRYYPDLKACPNPGEIHDFPETPDDGRWVPADTAVPAAQEPAEATKKAPADDTDLTAARAAAEAAEAAAEKAEAELHALEDKESA